MAHPVQSNKKRIDRNDVGINLDGSVSISEISDKFRSRHTARSGTIIAYLALPRIKRARKTRLH